MALDEGFERACKIARANASTFRRPYTVYRNASKKWCLIRGKMGPPGIDGVYTAEPDQPEKK